MNRARAEQGGDRRQVAWPALSIYLILVHLLVGGGFRLQTATRTHPVRWLKPSRGRAALAAVLGFVTVTFAGPAVPASAHPAAPVAAPAAAQPASQRAAPAATECDGAAMDKERAKGCFDTDPRLGPEQLPTTGLPGTVTAAVAKMTAGYHRFGNPPMTKADFLHNYWNGSPDPFRGGHWNYPSNGGFALDKNKMPIHHSQMLMVGTFVDRFGSSTSTYLAPAGTAYAKRAIPPSNLDTYLVLGGKTYHYSYHLYKVAVSFDVDAGPIAPSFGQKSGGLQYITCFSSDFSHPCASPNVDKLVGEGVLQEQALPGD
jgi:Tuberculosis necrotizing toxin